MENYKYFKSKYKEFYNEIFNYLVSKLEPNKVYDIPWINKYLNIIGYSGNATIIDLKLIYRKLNPVIQINTDLGPIEINESYTCLPFEDLIGLTEYIEKL